ncbi:diaminopimelate decarboxylase family protein [Nocardiopsis sp. NPDC057823]|uniref:diaminopimelate decarboxylase family protein n=1 Tax=Nocardiopsis sp. NPDC057823 TaxID=3346256 RepID=UPI00366C3B76
MPPAPLFTPPSELLFALAEDLPTPALVYDLPGIRAGVRAMARDIALIPDARLNLALKACHTPALLREMAALGLGCDIASPGELDLALAAGFTEVSATGPVFAGADFDLLAGHGITLDCDSLDQLDDYGGRRPGTEVGLRVRVTLPRSLEDTATFAGDSRFGVAPADPGLGEVLERHRLRVTRLHVHTGQMTPASLRYKVRYLLTVAEHLPEVRVIDLGGGFFHLYRDRAQAVAALTDAASQVADWRERTGRPVALRFEPGGALLTPYGYLVTRVRSVEEHHPVFGTRVVTLDASAWNLAPWHNRPQVLALHGAPPTGPALLAGCTLYENDFFGAVPGAARTALEVPHCRRGDRLVVTATGAYTMTNARWFNRIPPPREHLFDGERMTAADALPATAGAAR